MRVVLDTNILVRANPKAKGSARDLFIELAESEEHTLILSPFLLDETERVLAYSRLQAIWPLTSDEIQQYTQALNGLSEIVHPRSLSPVISKDPNDDPVIETAILGRADVLCTLDQDFYATEVVDLCRKHSIQIMTDADLLRHLRESEQKP